MFQDKIDKHMGCSHGVFLTNSVVSTLHGCTEKRVLK